MKLNVLLGDNLTTILLCVFKRPLLRVFVACSVLALYKTIINNKINHSALYNRLQCSLTVVDLYVLPWKQRPGTVL